MPIIRLAGSGGGGIEAAGQASAAFQQASQPGVQAFQRALEVNGQSQVQAAQIALRDQEQDAYRKQRELQAQVNKQNADRSNAIRYSGADTAAGKRIGMTAAPFDGFGAFQMFDELQQIDPETAQSIMAELGQEFGEYGEELTPEALGADPRFPSVYSRLSGAVIEARTQQRERSIMGSLEGAARTLREDFGDVLSKEEIEAFEGELAVDLADPDLSPAEAASIAKAARSKAAREAGRRKYVNGVVQEANDLLIETRKTGQVDPEVWNQAHDLIGDLRTAEDPDDVMAQIRLLVDPKAGAIARRAADDATRDLLAQQALARILAETKPERAASRKNAAPSREDLGQDMTGYRREVATQEAFGQTPGMPAQPPTGKSAAASPIAKFPKLSSLLAPDGEQTEDDMIAEELRSRGLPVTKENIQRYGMGIVAEQRLRNSGSAPTARGAMFQ